MDAEDGLLLLAEPAEVTSSGALANVLFAGRALGEAEIASLGGADADGILPVGADAAGLTQVDFDGGAPVTLLSTGTLGGVEAEGDPTRFRVVSTVASRPEPEDGLPAPEGVLLDRSNADDNLLLWSRPEAAAWTDYVLRAVDTGEFGVVFRYRDADNHYRLTFDVDGDARTLAKVQDGV